MHALPAMIALATSGCSFLFQQHLPSEYSGNSEPFCSDSKALPAIDGILAVLDVVGTIALASSPDAPGGTTLNVVSGIAETVLFASSALTGNNWANECRDAKASYYQDAATRGDADQQLARFKREHAIAKPVEPLEPLEARPVAPTPRGYFCSLSMSNHASGFCVREKAECERTRDLAIAALPDLSQCGLTEMAWCVVDLCFPTTEACDARRARTQIEAGCVESK